MSSLPKFATVLLLVTFCFPALSSTAAAQKGGVRSAGKKKQQKQEQPAPPPLPPYTPAPLQPVPLDQTPAVAPKVSFQDGQLSIVAHNSTLADVLRAVRKQTGAEMEIPPSASERVVADLGPGPARDVLAELLNGTHFNYVLVGSATDPTAVESIVLTPKSSSPENASVAQPTSPESPQRPLGQRGLPQTARVAPTPSGSVQDEASQTMDDSDEDSDQADAQDNQQQQNAPNSTPAESQTPKTPEQLLQELQRQQQQLQHQQQQQQQPGQPPAQPPQGLFPNLPPTQAPPPAKPE